MKNKDIAFFIKFGQEKYINDFFKNGTIYFNLVSNFIQTEGSKYIYDKLEGTKSLRNFRKQENYILTIDCDKEKPIKLNILNAQLREFDENVLGHIFCLYTLKLSILENKNIYSVDNRMFENNYTHCVFIEKVGEFLKRIQKELNKLEISFSWDLVKYQDFTEDNVKLNLFNKSNQFDFQNEFRILLNSNLKEPFSIKIGDISDIASIHESKLMNDLKIDFNHL